MKNYLIVGASSGIGKSLFEKLGSSENQVYGTYHSTTSDSNPQKMQRLDVLSGALDLSLLPDTLDGFIYCPGSINLKPFSRITPEEFLKDYELQVLGAIKSIQSVLPRLRESVQASIVLFSTIAVQMGFGFHAQVAASKGAIEGLTRSLAAEFAPQIRVNCIAPSLTQTPLAARLLNTELKVKANNERHPLKRIGKPDDISNMAAFLLSEDSSWITGQIMPVDGGMSSISL